MWCLSEELIALAFFDDELPMNIKENMVRSLRKPNKHDPVKRIRLDPELIMTKELPDFVTSNTMRFFTIMDLSSAFLQEPVKDCSISESYLAAQGIVKQLLVVNDIMEREVALIEE